MILSDRIEFVVARIVCLDTERQLEKDAHLRVRSFAFGGEIDGFADVNRSVEQIERHAKAKRPLKLGILVPQTSSLNT